MRSHVTAFRPISEAARSWSDDNVIINPVPAEYCESQEQLNCRIRNETINYAAPSHCFVPLLQCSTLPNIDAFNNDHDYFKLSPADNFLLVKHISPEVYQYTMLKILNI